MVDQEQRSDRGHERGRGATARCRAISAPCRGEARGGKRARRPRRSAGRRSEPAAARQRPPRASPRPCAGSGSGSSASPSPADIVGEVVPVEALTPVPLAPPAILGLFNLRGTPVALVDLGGRSGCPTAGRRSRAPASRHGAGAARRATCCWARSSAAWRWWCRRGGALPPALREQRGEPAGGGVPGDLGARGAGDDGAELARELWPGWRAALPPDDDEEARRGRHGLLDRRRTRDLHRRRDPA